MTILGIETSCDDTCAAIVKATGGTKRPRFTILSNIRSSQVDIHQEFGGVVPNLAARAHVENMNAVLKLAFKKAGLRIKEAKTKIDLIAVTSHPGLIPCLLVGTNVARTLAWFWDKPIVGVNHLEGHVYANWTNDLAQKERVIFPVLSLIVSGGHTQLVLMRGIGKFKIIGETRDDASGEAFDKVARLLGLSFPGGPPISQKAAKGNPHAFLLPRPMLNSPDYDFSFSGLKTAVLYLVQDLTRKKKLTSKQVADIAASFQQAVVDVLISKTVRAAISYEVKTVILGGGVAANKELKKQLRETLQKKLSRISYLYPPPGMAVDNAAMIAMAAYFRYRAGGAKTWKDIKVRAVI